jgi:hypothetical protein
MINLTPHIVTVRGPDGVDHVFQPSGQVAKVEMKTQMAKPLEDGTPTCKVSYGSADLPVTGETQCIVSTLFADAYRSQNGPGSVELFVPDSGPSAIRENGQVVAVRSLIRK